MARTPPARATRTPRTPRSPCRTPCTPRSPCSPRSAPPLIRRILITPHTPRSPIRTMTIADAPPSTPPKYGDVRGGLFGGLRSDDSITFDSFQSLRHESDEDSENLATIRQIRAPSRLWRPRRQLVQLPRNFSVVDWYMSLIDPPLLQRNIL